MADKRYGLFLDLPGAPATAHTVPGLAGYYWPDRPTPVGGDGELPLDVARAAAKDDGVPLRIDEITPAQAKTANAEIRAFRAEARHELASSRADKRGGERVIADEELAKLADAAPAAAGDDGTEG